MVTNLDCYPQELSDVLPISQNPKLLEKEARYRNNESYRGKRNSYRYSTTRNETTAAKTAYIDYVALGPNRTMKDLHRQYLAAEDPDLVPTISWQTLRHWFERWRWEDRINALIDKERREVERREKEYRHTIMETGYALAHERIQGLKNLAQRLEEDIKKCPSKESGKLTALIRELRGVMEDIAKEQGQRKNSIEHTGSEAAPVIVFQSTIPRPGDKPAPEPHSDSDSSGSS